MMSSRLHEHQVQTEKREEEEEEILTHYEPKEQFGTESQPQQNGSPLNRGWEFKIVRASRDLFRDPTVFQHLCREEAQAGWTLLEKLDDRRVRFRRAIATRNKVRPENLGFDPYRCYYGSAGTSKIWLAAIALILAIAIPAYAGYWVMSKFVMPAHRQITPNPESPKTFPNY